MIALRYEAMHGPEFRWSYDVATTRPLRMALYVNNDGVRRIAKERG